MYESMMKVITGYGLISGFAVIGITMWVSYWISNTFTKGRLHGSAIAILLGLVLSGWFYLTPIVYPLSYVPQRFQGAIAANPLSALVGLYRRALFGGEGSVAGLGGLIVVSAVVLCSGWFVFRRAKPAFADLI